MPNVVEKSYAYKEVAKHKLSYSFIITTPVVYTKDWSFEALYRYYRLRKFIDSYYQDDKQLFEKSAFAALGFLIDIGKRIAKKSIDIDYPEILPDEDDAVSLFWEKSPRLSITFDAKSEKFAYYGRLDNSSEINDEKVIGSYDFDFLAWMLSNVQS